MTIINDMWTYKGWNKPGGQYQPGLQYAPRANGVMQPKYGNPNPAPVYGANSPQGVYGRNYANNITSNYNVKRKMTGLDNGGYYGWYWYNYTPNYNYNNYNNYGNRGYDRPQRYNRRYGTNILDRAVTDANAGYQWNQREIEQIRRAAQNNPEYAKQLAQNYKTTGSFWDNSKSIDYGIPYYDENGNYVRESFRRTR